MSLWAMTWRGDGRARRWTKGTARFFLAWFFRGLFLVSISLAGAKTQNGAPTESQIKANFLSSFTKFVEWPPESLFSKGSRLQICILGETGFSDELEKATRGETVKGHRIEIIHDVKNVGQIDRCHILFVSASATGQFRKLREELRGRSILTVGESAGFVEQGGMINFVRDGGIVLLEVNQTRAQAAGLKISAKLLSVAKAVTVSGGGQGR